MTIKSVVFSCPGCGSQFSVDDNLVGAEVRCLECDAVLEVPDPGAGAIAGLDDTPTQTADRPPVATELPVTFRGEDRGGEAEMDMTPMVDVTFLLLIFFMVTAAFSLQKSFEVPAPEQDQASQRTLDQLQDDTDYVTVRVDEYNTFYVSAAGWDEEIEAPSQQDLLVKLRDAIQAGSAGSGVTRMLVLASGEAHHEKVVTAMDAGTAVGMEDVKLVTVEEDDEF